MVRYVFPCLLTAAVIGGSFGIAHAEGPQPIRLADEAHKHGEGEKHKLGRQKIGNYTVSVILIGEAEAGKEAELDIKLIDAKEEPKALRAWIGKEDGADKAIATKKKTTYDADVKVPSPLPKDAKVWIEIETAAGTEKGSFAIEDKHDHKG